MNTSLLQRLTTFGAALAIAVTMSLPSSIAHAATTVVIPSNNTSPGDSYTNPGPVNQGQAVGSTDWYYNNTRNNGVVGINDTYARSGNGSAYMSVAGSSGKADIEHLSDGASFMGNYVATSSLGLLSDLKYLSYDYYRDGSSAAASHLHPVVRILLDMDGNLATINDRGGLVYEAIYNGDSVVNDTWVTTTVFDGGANDKNMWSFGLGKPSFADGYDVSVSEWMIGSEIIAGNPVSVGSANATVLGFSMGVGSGWGAFEGAVDNLTFEFDGGMRTTHNFEVAALTPVPEVTTVATGAFAGIIGVSMLVRRFRKTASTTTV